MKILIQLIILLIFSEQVNAKTLQLGWNKQYHSFTDAAKDVVPGDTILCHEGAYEGNQFITGLQGSSEKWIYILANGSDNVSIHTGITGLSLTEAAFIHIEGILFEHQKGYNLKINDGGSFDTPSHDIIFRNCTFRNMVGGFIKDNVLLTGVQNFEFDNCHFSWSGYTGIQMIGCHNGKITNCTFENLYFGIIVRGGSQNINIERNIFKKISYRSVSIGGVTEDSLFRPLDASFEAADLNVFSNIFIGGAEPIAFIGCIRSSVINNTFVLPKIWVINILQENVDPGKLAPCGDNVFINNIIYKDNKVINDCNIGPDTKPETFTFSNNLWYNKEDEESSPPIGLPVPDQNNITGIDPAFINIDTENFGILATSPAAGHGLNLLQSMLDYFNFAFLNPRSIGAYEVNPVSKINDEIEQINFEVYPNPILDEMKILWNNVNIVSCEFELYNVSGNLMLKKSINNGFEFRMKELPSGFYFIILKNNENFIGFKKVAKI